MNATSPTWEFPADVRLGREQLRLFLAAVLDEGACVERQPFIQEVPALPLSEFLWPAGESFVAIGREISAGGITLLHCDPVRAPFLALELVSPTREAVIRAPLEVVSCQERNGYFEINGKFVVQDSA